MRRFMLIVIPIILAACVACEPPRVPVLPPVNTGDYVFADSLGAQIQPAINAEKDGRVWKVMSGADLAYWQTQVNTAISKRPRSITLALGSNDGGTWTGGWTSQDDVRWRDTIKRAHDKGICVAGVLPWFTQDAEVPYPGVNAQIAVTRAALQAMPFDSIVDWRPTVEANPALITTDGIHLVTFSSEYTPPMAARYAVVNQSAEGCE